MFRKVLPNYDAHSFINAKFSVSNELGAGGIYALGEFRAIYFDFSDNGRRTVIKYTFSFQNILNAAARSNRWAKREFDDLLVVLNDIRSIKQNYITIKETQLKLEDIKKILKYMDEIVKDLFAIGEQDAVVVDTFGSVFVDISFNKKSSCAIL